MHTINIDEHNVNRQHSNKYLCARSLEPVTMNTDRPPHTVTTSGTNAAILSATTLPLQSQLVLPAGSLVQQLSVLVPNADGTYNRSALQNSLDLTSYPITTNQPASLNINQQQNKVSGAAVENQVCVGNNEVNQLGQASIYQQQNRKADTNIKKADSVGNDHASQTELYSICKNMKGYENKSETVGLSQPKLFDSQPSSRSKYNTVTMSNIHTSKSSECDLFGQIHLNNPQQTTGIAPVVSQPSSIPKLFYVNKNDTVPAFSLLSTPSTNYQNTSTSSYKILNEETNATASIERSRANNSTNKAITTIQSSCTPFVVDTSAHGSYTATSKVTPVRQTLGGSSVHSEPCLVGSSVPYKQPDLISQNQQTSSINKQPVVHSKADMLLQVQIMQVFNRQNSRTLPPPVTLQQDTVKSKQIIASSDGLIRSGSNKFISLLKRGQLSVNSREHVDKPSACIRPNTHLPTADSAILATESTEISLSASKDNTEPDMIIESQSNNSNLQPTSVLTSENSRMPQVRSVNNNDEIVLPAMEQSDLIIDDHGDTNYKRNTALEDGVLNPTPVSLINRSNMKANENSDWITDDSQERNEVANTSLGTSGTDVDDDIIQNDEVRNTKDIHTAALYAPTLKPSILNVCGSVIMKDTNSADLVTDSLSETVVALSDSVVEEENSSGDGFQLMQNHVKTYSADKGKVGSKTICVVEGEYEIVENISDDDDDVPVDDDHGDVNDIVNHSACQESESVDVNKTSTTYSRSFQSETSNSLETEESEEDCEKDSESTVSLDTDVRSDLECLLNLDCDSSCSENEIPTSTFLDIDNATPQSVPHYSSANLSSKKIVDAGVKTSEPVSSKEDSEECVENIEDSDDDVIYIPPAPIEVVTIDSDSDEETIATDANKVQVVIPKSSEENKTSIGESTNNISRNRPLVIKLSPSPYTSDIASLKSSMVTVSRNTTSFVSQKKPTTSGAYTTAKSLFISSTTSSSRLTTGTSEFSGTLGNSNPRVPNLIYLAPKSNATPMIVSIPKTVSQIAFPPKINAIPMSVVSSSSPQPAVTTLPPSTGACYILRTGPTGQPLLVPVSMSDAKASTAQTMYCFTSKGLTTTCSAVTTTSKPTHSLPVCTNNSSGNTAPCISQCNKPTAVATGQAVQTDNSQCQFPSGNALPFAFSSNTVPFTLFNLNPISAQNVIVSSASSTLPNWKVSYNNEQTSNRFLGHNTHPTISSTVQTTVSSTVCPRMSSTVPQFMSLPRPRTLHPIMSSTCPNMSSTKHPTMSSVACLTRPSTTARPTNSVYSIKRPTMPSKTCPTTSSSSIMNMFSIKRPIMASSSCTTMSSILRPSMSSSSCTTLSSITRQSLSSSVCTTTSNHIHPSMSTSSCTTMSSIMIPRMSGSSCTTASSITRPRMLSSSCTTMSSITHPSMSSSDCTTTSSIRRPSMSSAICTTMSTITHPSMSSSSSTTMSSMMHPGMSSSSCTTTSSITRQTTGMPTTLPDSMPSTTHVKTQHKVNPLSLSHIISQPIVPSWPLVGTPACDTLVSYMKQSNVKPDPESKFSIRRRPDYDNAFYQFVGHAGTRPSKRVGGKPTNQDNAKRTKRTNSSSDTDSDVEEFNIGETTTGEKILPVTRVLANVETDAICDDDEPPIRKRRKMCSADKSCYVVLMRLNINPALINNGTTTLSHDDCSLSCRKNHLKRLFKCTY